MTVTEVEEIGSGIVTIVKDHVTEITESGSKEDEDEIPILGITIASILIIVPVCTCVAFRVIANKCPSSALGRKLNACKESNAMTEEQM